MHRSRRRSLRRTARFAAAAAVFVLVLGGAALVALSSRRSSGVASVARVTEAHGKWNVILISLDTLRADHLGCYGYPRDTSPAIDALAARGVRFANVVSESSWTTPSHMTLFTGLYPTTHGVRQRGLWLFDHITTLPEVLQQHGYRTFAFTGGGCISKYDGFARGFERFYVKGYRGLGDALDHAQQHIDESGADERFFAFIHAYDLHAPYEREEPYASTFVSPQAEPFENWHRTELAFKNEGTKLTPGNFQFLIDRYDGSIRRADERLAGFFAHLDEAGRFEDTVVVFLSDHGEELGEHGSLGHRTVYRECLGPPIIMVAPGAGPRVVEHGVGLKDVMPTILELVAVRAPPCQGVSLVPLLRGEAMAPWPLFSELDTDGNFRSVVWDRKHLILKAFSDHARLFDWRTDPTEQVNIAGQSPELVARLIARMPVPPESVRHPDVPLNPDERLTPWWSSAAPPERLTGSEKTPESDGEPSAEEIKKLQALGYVGPS